MYTLDPATFFSSVLEMSSVRIAVIDPELKVVYINRTELIPREQLIGTSILNIIPEEAWPHVRSEITDVFGKGKICKGVIRTFPAGKEVYFDYQYSPYYIEGKVAFVIASYEDNTKEYLQQREVTEKQAQLSAILNNTSDIILSIDRQYNIIEFNDVLAKKVKVGFNKSLKKGDSVFEVFFQPDRQALTKIYERVFDGERVSVTETFQVAENQFKYYQTSYNPIVVDGSVSGIAIFSQDVTEIKESERKVISALHEKEVLLSEIHHRVKNNLAAISSIIQLHSLNTENTETLDLLNAAQTRLKTTALVHEMLYENDSLSHIDFRDYIRRLCTDIDLSYRAPGLKLQITLIADEAQVNIRQAIPCGLLLNEMLTNAYKHAFKDKDNGCIFIEFRKNGKKVSLSVSDDGGKLTKDFDPAQHHSTGMILIQTLTEQLEGKLIFNKNELTEFRIEFLLED